MQKFSKQDFLCWFFEILQHNFLTAPLCWHLTLICNVLKMGYATQGVEIFVIVHLILTNTVILPNGSHMEIWLVHCDEKSLNSPVFLQYVVKKSLYYDHCGNLHRYYHIERCHSLLILRVENWDFWKTPSICQIEEKICYSDLYVTIYRKIGITMALYNFFIHTYTFVGNHKLRSPSFKAVVLKVVNICTLAVPFRRHI